MQVKISLLGVPDPFPVMFVVVSEGRETIRCGGLRGHMSEGQNGADFMRCFLKVEPALRGYLFATVRNPTETAELLQEVALVLWRKFGEFDRQRSFGAWAMGIAKMQVLKRRQAYARSKLLLSEEAVAALAETACEEPEAEDDRMAHLAGCLDKLPSGEKTVLSLRMEKNLSMAEIGALVRKSEAAVAMMMMRIRRWLRQCVEEAMARERAGVS